MCFSVFCWKTREAEGKCAGAVGWRPRLQAFGVHGGASFPRWGAAMPVSVHRFDQHGLVVLKITERLDDVTAWEAYEKLEEEALHFDRVNELIDLRDLDVTHLTTRCLMSIASREKVLHAGKIRRRGVVVSQPVIVGLVNMFHGVSRSPGAEYRFFDELDEALEWVGAEDLAEVIRPQCETRATAPRRDN